MNAEAKTLDVSELKHLESNLHHVGEIETGSDTERTDRFQLIGNYSDEGSEVVSGTNVSYV